jgi:hypothetical protein
MEILYFLFWFMVLSPLLPFVVLISTGLTLLALHTLAALAGEHL